MNFNRKYISIFGVIGIVMVALGIFLFSTNSSGSTAPADPDTAQALTVKARDTAQQPLRGVAVALLDSNFNEVDSGTTRTNGEVELTFNPKAGTYMVRADEPTDYKGTDDKDGGASQVTGPNCSNVYLCIYLTATDVRDKAGNTSTTVELTHVKPEQVGELDDLWFEMTPPSSNAEDESAVAIDDQDADVLIGDPDDDVLIGGPSDDVIGGPGNDVLIGDSDDNVPADPRLGRICVNVNHTEVVDQNSPSAILIRGEIFHIESGTVVVESPTVNGGAPVEIPVSNGQFDGPLGINQFGDHELTRFELNRNDPNAGPVDFLPTLLGGPGTIFTVTANEGPAFESECFNFEAPTNDPAEGATAEELEEQIQAANEATVGEFVSTFVQHHVDGDVQALLDTLHPAVPLVFGDESCDEYVARTTGSITGAKILEVWPMTQIELDSADGPVVFTDAIPFTVEFDLPDGGSTVNEANLVLHEDVPHWLTRCGFEN